MASRYHINVKTVAKWRKRKSVEDSPMAPREPHSTILTAEQEAMIVAFHRRTLLPGSEHYGTLARTLEPFLRTRRHRRSSRAGD